MYKGRQACCGQLVKMLRTLEPYEIPGIRIKFCILISLNTVQLVVCKTAIRVHHFGLSRSFVEKVHNSWTAWYILFSKFCILIHFNIIETQVHVCKSVTRLRQE